MKFSFLMCVNKYVPFLANAIDSVLNQSDPEFSFLIIANNCNDDLWTFLSEYKDSRIVLQRTLIGQLSFNLNYGLNIIESGYVLRMDADDICLVNRLAVTKYYLSKYNWPDIIGGQAILIDEMGNDFGLIAPPLSNKEIRTSLWLKNPMIHPTCALRVESVLKLRGYLGGFMSEDYDLWLRASRQDSFVFRNVSEPLIKYRINDGQSRKDVLGYAEVAGYMLREGLLGRGYRYFCGTLLGVFKRYVRAKN